MIVDLLTFDPGFHAASPTAYADEVIRLISDSWESGADLTVLPEFTWMGLEPLIKDETKQRDVHAVISDLFWQTLLPRISGRLVTEEKAVVMGTVPFEEAASGLIHNRAPILVNGKLLHQDKLHLTPWERAFSPGKTLHLWHFHGFKIAVIICLDIEIPEISSCLRGQEVDLIICPSATETILGVERVDRCASARAVELGCHVVVTHLTGKAHSELIDENIGRLAHYAPSQASFRKAPRWTETDVFDHGVHQLRIELDTKPLEIMRRMTVETNPSHLGKESAGQFSIFQIES